MSKITRGQAEAAAAWWVERLRKPTFDNLGPTAGRNAKETYQNLFVSALAESTAEANSPDDAKLEAFRAALVEGILSMDGFPSLYSDYHPDRALSEAAQVADVDRSRFPWKTGTWFEGGTVLAACGYGAARVQIYPEAS